MDKDGINVLSCFDGISCGQIALERAGIKVKNYFASEIDKFAIKVTQHNYPNTIQLGDIENWRNWELPEIDLIIGGSPCQGFSFAGKGLNFDDPRSRLFFTFADIVKHYKPKNFLLENVRMKKESKDVITEYMGVEPILIDSALVSAQSRKRLYWSTAKNLGQPEDKDILFSDIIDDIRVSPLWEARIKYSISAKYRQDRPIKIEEKAISVTTTIGSRTFISDKGEYLRLTPAECERLQTVPDNYTSVVSNSQRYKSLGNGWTVDVIVHILNHMEF